MLRIKLFIFIHILSTIKNKNPITGLFSKRVRVNKRG